MSNSLFRPRTALLGLALLTASGYFIHHAGHLFTSAPDVLGKYQPVKWLLWLHISFGAVTLLTGPFLLWDNFRTRYLGLHRQFGLAYVVAVAVSGLCAVVLSATTAYHV